MDQRKGARKGKQLLGGSWVVISGVIGPHIWVIVIVPYFLTPLIATHEPPSMERQPNKKSARALSPSTQPSARAGSASSGSSPCGCCRGLGTKLVTRT